MLRSLTILLSFQLVGEALTQALALPIPGPVIGMTLLLAALVWPRLRTETLRHNAQQLLGQLSLLFVPAGVGVMLHARRIGEEWLPIAAALVVSTLLAIAVGALTMALLARRVRTPD
jgi:holin-like protein